MSRTSLALGAIVGLGVIGALAVASVTREPDGTGRRDVVASPVTAALPTGAGPLARTTSSTARSAALRTASPRPRPSPSLSATLGPVVVEPLAREVRSAPQRGASRPADRRRLRLVRSFSGGMAPKSIVADQRGRYFAMNVMYGHSITVFDRRYKRVKDIPDSIDLSRYGHEQYSEPVRGAPVEGAVSPDGRTLYVSNYSMYGKGFKHPGFDLCTPRDRIDRSFVYAIDTRSLRTTDAIEVGAVPKYLAIAPNGRTMLVGNWCSWDLSVVDLRKGREVARIPAGVAPRGIAFSPSGRLAYVTLVGEDRVLIVDMRIRQVVGDIGGVGERPRHLVMSPDGRHLYVTSEGKDKPKRVDGVVHKVAVRSGRIVASSPPLTEPRTTVMSDDGTALYVVDYYPGTIVKLATKDLSVLQDRYLGYHPVGVTYDTVTDKVWVAGYGGQVWVLTDR